MDEGPKTTSNATEEKNSQLLPNNTRSVGRIFTEKLPIPILENNDPTPLRTYGGEILFEISK